jgi:hypothetical protein
VRQDFSPQEVNRGSPGRGPKSKLKAYQKDRFFVDAMSTIEFSRNKTGAIENLTTTSLVGNEVQMALVC